MTDERCGAVIASCTCDLAPDHEGPHECEDRIVCNGAWEDRLGPFETVRLPGTVAP